MKPYFKFDPFFYFQFSHYKRNQYIKKSYYSTLASVTVVH